MFPALSMNILQHNILLLRLVTWSSSCRTVY